MAVVAESRLAGTRRSSCKGSGSATRRVANECSSRPRVVRMKKTRRVRRKTRGTVGSRGVVIYLERVVPGVIKICFDDCEKRRRNWAPQTLFTHFQVAEEQLRRMKLPNRRLRDIGLMVTARLLALEGLV